MRSAGALPSQREKKLKEQNSSRCPVALLMNSLKEARCPLAGPPANLFGWRDACGLQLASRGGEPREQEEVVVVVDVVLMVLVVAVVEVEDGCDLTMPTQQIKWWWLTTDGKGPTGKALW